VGTKPVDREPADGGTRVAEYCREIETYLCKKNDGHLIRVTGPSFDLVSHWAERGVPLKVAFAGIDRYVERYYRSGPRRRPVKIDFCDADVLDVFDEWRRATGVTAAASAPVLPGPEPAAAAGHQSLPAHLGRVLMRLTNARASGQLGVEFDGIIDRLAGELDAARAKPGGVRGDARAALVARLAALDAEMLATARAALGGDAFVALDHEAEEELAPFRPHMAADAYQRSREAVLARLVREGRALPTIAFE
jgi:hypothetical protein